MSVEKLVEGLKGKGIPHKIPDCSRNDLPEFFKSLGFEVGAEVGVYKGEFSKKFLGAGLKMYCIDPWRALPDYKGKPHEISKRHMDFQRRQNFLYCHTERYLKTYIDKGKCELIRKTSMEAVEDFKDGSLDFVYIDGHHGLKYITEDLWDWSRKIRKGGVICGHDYAINKKDARDPYVIHVKYGVHAFTRAFNIQSWYVLGRDEYVEGEVRDKWRSWMWFI